MSEFIDVVTSFPSVVFTVALLVSIGYWIVATVLGLDGVDVDAEFDTDVDVDVDGAEAGGGLGSLFTALDLHLMPVSLVITVISLVGWIVSVLASIAIGSDGVVGVVVGIVILLAALAAGVLLSGRVARLLSPIFSPGRAVGDRDLIGRVCVLKTSRVDASFGQAEVVDHEGGSHLIDIRCHIENGLSRGDQALLVEVDDGVFTVSPDVDAIR